ncbi:uncharacterized protein LOC122791766 [Protopterus annectens]|uniref:uncharacterized protein LOC122791766 n=1 Tax=Protopterus annectens TaxID=7888 RepID=UPI001CFA0C5F|nr:uncharacterized protein LOC122791766 [Protopterus annectens]
MGCTEEDFPTNCLMRACTLHCKARMVCASSNEESMTNSCSSPKNSSSVLARSVTVVWSYSKMLQQLLSFGLARGKYWWNSLVSSLKKFSEYAYSSLGFSSKIKGITMELIQSTSVEACNTGLKTAMLLEGRAMSRSSGFMAGLKALPFSGTPIGNMTGSMTETTSCHHKEHLAKLVPSCTGPVLMTCSAQDEEVQVEGNVSDWYKDLDTIDLSSGAWLDIHCVVVDGQQTSYETGDEHIFFPCTSEDDGAWSDSEWSSDSEDEADIESTDIDDESEQLWNSFFLNDPYNPMCFSNPIGSFPKYEEKGEFICSTAKNSFETLVDWDTSKCEILDVDKESEFETLEKEKQLEKSQDQRSKVFKKVRFSDEVKVHHMIAWDYAYRAARKGPWEQYARDRCRFQRRIKETEFAVGYCFLPQHREEAWRRLQAAHMQTDWT